jgi:hypothetical protein
VRELAELDPGLARRYLAAVAAVTPAVEAGLSDRVLANRAVRTSVDPPAIRLGSWRDERRAFAALLRRRSRQSARVVLADVRQCYGSIRPDVVAGSLRRLGCEPSAASEVRATLQRIAEAGRFGLPVGPVASAVLANAVLSSVDEALDRAGVHHLRWVDDVVAFLDDARAPGDVFDLLKVALGELGLALNAAKSRVLTPAELSHGAAVSIPRGGAGVG